MTSYAMALVDAVRDALKSDAAVAALVDVRVYDEVPRDQRGRAGDVQTPYIRIGPLGGQPYRDGCFRGWNVRFRVYGASTEFGRAEAWACIDAVTLALEYKTLDLGAAYHQASPFMLEPSGDVIDPLAVKEAFADFTCLIMRKTEG